MDNLKDKRIKFDTYLRSLLGSTNVYFESPSNITMKYPAFRYTLRPVTNRNANNGVYNAMLSYEVTYISSRMDLEVLEKILKTPYCRHDSTYWSDGLWHCKFTIYY